MKLLTDLSEEKTKETFKEQIKGVFSKGDKVAVKLHMGEKDNKFYLKPRLVKIFVDVLKDKGISPFLFDSVVLYTGARDTKEKYLKTAKDHGFNPKAMGCPIVISEEGIDVETKHLNVHVCKEMAEIDGMLVLSHSKGHCCYGYGGAVKNIGMGCVTPDSKRDIHTLQTASTDELLAEGASAVLKQVKKIFFVNFLIDISKECDCANNAGPIVVDDIGILFGKSAARIDRKSLDLINKEKKDVFRKLHHHDPYLHVKYAEKLGL